MLPPSKKGEIFRAILTIKASEKFKNVSLANDANKEEMILRKEVQMLFNEAISKPNVQAKMKGTKLEIYGKTYNKANFDNLPHGLSLESAVTVITESEVAFKGIVRLTATYICYHLRMGHTTTTV